MIMFTVSLLAACLTGEIVLASLAVAVVLVSAIIRHGRWRHRQRWMPALQVAFLEGLADNRWVAAFLRLPPALQPGFLVQVEPQLTSDARQAIRNSLWAKRAPALCRAPWWPLRLWGLRLCQMYGIRPQGLEARLNDPSPNLRAQALRLLSQDPGEADFALLLARLNDPVRMCRMVAEEVVIGLGQKAVQPLAALLDCASGFAAVGGLRVACRLPDPRFMAAALKHTEDPLAVVRNLAAHLLGHLGGKEAADRLCRLLMDQEASVRQAAVMALCRMNQWQAAAGIAERLSDPAWNVRRAAAIGLRQLGGPGQLFLTKALSGTDAFAADMARQVLDLPAAAFLTDRG